MKNIITLITTTANAAGDVNPVNTATHNLIWELSALFAVAIIMYSIVQMLKNRMDYQLKNKMIEKGVSKELAASLLHEDPDKDRNIHIKWFALLAGGTVLTIMYYTPPVGLHSPAIFTIIVYFSLWGYKFFLRKAPK